MIDLPLLSIAPAQGAIRCAHAWRAGAAPVAACSLSFAGSAARVSLSSKVAARRLAGAARPWSFTGVPHE
jgi:hypothetical protein